MDQHTSETRFARCSQLWDAARNFRNYRTHQQDQTTRRNHIKANALDATTNMLLVTAALAAGLGIYHLLSNGNQSIAVITAIAVAFGVDSFLTPMLADTFGLIADRLRGIDTDTTETEAAR